MTDCTHVQELLSAAADGERLDRDELDAARSHCRQCAACAAFVTGLAAMRRLDAGELPQPVLERLLDAVRAEYALRADAPDPAPGPAARAAPAPRAGEPADIVRQAVPAGVRRLPAWTRWAAAAAALVVAAGVITAQGVRYLLQPSPPGIQLEEAAVQTPQPGQERAADQAAPEAPPPAESGVAAADGPSYIVFEGDVYTLAGPAGPPAADAAAGEVTTGLDTGEPAVAHGVYRGTAPHTLVLETADGATLGFVAVTRTLRGATYILRSGPIAAFGQWPSLPDGIPEPASPDGTPTFIRAGTDDLGVTIFVRPGTDPSDGFAVAPSTAAADPAAGNTGWTWWAPRR